LNPVILIVLFLFCSWLREIVSNQPILSLWLTIYMYGRSSSTSYWLSSWCIALHSNILSYRRIECTEDGFLPNNAVVDVRVFFCIFLCWSEALSHFFWHIVKLFVAHIFRIFIIWNTGGVKIVSVICEFYHAVHSCGSLSDSCHWTQVQFLLSSIRVRHPDPANIAAML